MHSSELDALVAAYDSVFEAHMSLWKAMIQTARGEGKFTAEDLNAYNAKISEAEDDLAKAIAGADEQTAIHAQAIHDKKLMDEHGLLFDADMIADVDTVVGNMMLARPTLIVGDKGIAKTQLAKFVMSLFGTDPIVVSVRGDMMSDELIGQLKHDKEQGTFRFYEGAVPKAMRAGLPVLLDEINFGDQAIVARLQDILLKKPGQMAFIQEEDETIEVQPGFTLLATANEASERYRHREILDPAIRDRFEIVVRGYPDLDLNPLFDDAPSLSRLAFASLVDDEGNLSDHIDPEMLDNLIRIAAITEHLYAVPAKEATIKFDEGAVSSLIRESAEPVLTDCITPRALCRAVEDSAGGNLPGRILDMELIAKLVRSLDQAGSHNNFTLVDQAAQLVDIQIPAAR